MYLGTKVVTSSQESLTPRPGLSAAGLQWLHCQMSSEDVCLPCFSTLPSSQPGRFKVRGVAGSRKMTSSFPTFPSSQLFCPHSQASSMTEMRQGAERRHLSLPTSYHRSPALTWNPPLHRGLSLCSMDQCCH